jgi:DNA polymerase-4
MRTIIHLDMDCFYAAIEVRDDPTLRGQPVAVGGARSRRGVLTTCNYEAREFGVRSAMPTFMALRKCPHLVVVPVHFEKYRHESARIRAIMHEYTDLVEPLSLDEAYLDVTASGRAGGELAREIRRRTYQTTGLTASAGIAPNKLLAKIASDWKKPNGQFELTTPDVAAFMRELPVRKIWGIGPKTADKLAKAGITTCGQLQDLPALRMNELFGSFGAELRQLCRGEDDRPVQPHRVRKSLSTERTFERNLSSLEECRQRLEPIYSELLEDLRRHTEARAVTGVFVKLKFADFSQTTVSRAGARPDARIYDELLCEGFGRSGESIRLLGIGVRFSEGSAEEETQLELPLA